MKLKKVTLGDYDLKKGLITISGKTMKGLDARVEIPVDDLEAIRAHLTSAIDEMSKPDAPTTH